jgi:alkylation response protein AidB-like acyl-CoA dehydrogenase
MELRIRNKSTYHNGQREMITAIGMTEPNCGSDLKASTTAEGDHYVVNGQKTFITNGHMCDMAIVAVKQIIIHKEGVPCLLLQLWKVSTKDFLINSV